MLAHAGLGSRRACEDLITQGRVTIDGQIARELGTRVDPASQKVAVDGQAIHQERMVYFAVHKPKGYVSSNHDPAGKPLVVSLLPEVPQRVYTVGRLDEQSTGLMLLTNDGELANRLAHPKFGVEKVYRVVVAGEPSREVLDQLTQGIWLAEGKVRAKRVRVIGHKGHATILEMVLGEGKNREIRRMLARLGHKVMSLTRIAVGPIGLKGLAVGQHRALSAKELEILRKVATGEYVPPPRFADRRPRVPRDLGAKGVRHLPPDAEIPDGPAPERRPAPAYPPRREGRPGPGGRPPAHAGRSPQAGRPPAPAGRPPQHGRPPAPASNRPPQAGRPPIPTGPRSHQAARPPAPAGPRPPQAARPRPEGRSASAPPPRPQGPRPPRPEGESGAGRPPRFVAGQGQGQGQGARPGPGQDGPRRRPPLPSPAGGPAGPRPKRGPRPSEGPPPRRVIGLETETNNGPRGRRPTPRRSPRSAHGVKRRPPAGGGSEE